MLERSKLPLYLLLVRIGIKRENEKYIATRKNNVQTLKGEECDLVFKLGMYMSWQFFKCMIG